MPSSNDKVLLGLGMNLDVNFQLTAKYITMLLKFLFVLKDPESSIKGNDALLQTFRT
jgi:hypothetical protein